MNKLALESKIGRLYASYKAFWKKLSQVSSLHALQASKLKHTQCFRQPRHFDLPLMRHDPTSFLS